MRNHDQIVYHDSQHEDERERDDIIEAVSDGFQVDEIAQVHDQERQHDEP